MTKLLFLLLLFPQFAFAECAGAQHTPIQIDIAKSLDSAVASNHMQMHIITISVPAIVNDTPLKELTLTRGEVTEFIIPLAYEILEDTAEARFMALANSAEGFEVTVHYHSDGCSFASQQTI